MAEVPAGDDSVFTENSDASRLGATMKSEMQLESPAVIDLTRDVVDLRADPSRQRLDERQVPLRLVQPQIRKWRRLNRVAKAVLDYCVASISLVVFAPVALLVAAAIKIDDRGPVYFLQRRVGRHGTTFCMVKFRTMAVDADESVHREHTIRLAGELAPLMLEEDPRITRVGRFLRRWSLDELPNLFNVFAGQMSIVGPRPLVTYEAELLSPEERRRFQVKPGITGLAQVNGRLAIGPGERTSFDIQYVERNTFWMDLSIVTRTLPSMLRSKG